MRIDFWIATGIVPDGNQGEWVLGDEVSTDLVERSHQNTEQEKKRVKSFSGVTEVGATNNPSRTNLVEHRIDSSESLPIKQRY